MDRIAVFARWPEVGRVKTRLSPALPPEMACALFVAMIEDALAAARYADAERFLYWAHPPLLTPDRPVVRGAEDFEQRVQREGDLGARIVMAFTDLLQAPGDRAIVIGSDCPDLDGAAIQNAFEALETHDMAVVPTRDGGYAAIGLRRQAEGLFQGVEWSGWLVLDRTLEKAGALGLAHVQLLELEDIDTPADLVRWIGRTIGTRRSLHTVDALRSMGLFPPAPPAARP